MKQVIWVIVVLLVIWGVYALATSKTDAPTTDGTVPAGEDSSATDTSGTPAEVSMVEVSDQKAGKSVLVASYTLSAPGYITVHAATAEKTAGAIIGNSELLQAGSAVNVEVPLTVATKDGQSVIVMLHLDNGDGKFDGTLDLPATAADVSGAQAVVMKTVAVKK